MTKPVVTVHAVRRFAERVLGVEGLPGNDDEALKIMREVHGLDTDEIRRLLGVFVTQAVMLRATAVTLRGARYVLRGKTLVTVVPARAGWRPH